MLLCLRKADAEKNERELNVSSSVLSMLDEVAANAKDVGEQLPMVSGASEVIRTYLNIGDYRSETLPDNLMDLNTIFDRVLLVPYKEKKDVENFRKLWNKRIALEATLLQNNSASDKKTAEAEKATFLTKRQWDREKACFELGDQVAALEKMKSLISSIKEPSEKQQRHPRPGIPASYPGGTGETPRRAHEQTHAGRPALLTNRRQAPTSLLSSPVA